MGSQIESQIYDYQRDSSGAVVNYGNWLGSEGGTAVGGRYYSGTIQSNVTWQTSDHLIGILGPLTVASNIVLTVQPGVEIQVLGNYQLDIAGALRALGQSTNPIVFTSGQLSPAPGDWQGLKFSGSGASSGILSNTVVEYAQNGIWCLNASPAIVNSHIQRQSDSGYYLDTSSPTILSNLIELNVTGVYCYQSASPLIQGNTVVLNSNMEFTCRVRRQVRI